VNQSKHKKIKPQEQAILKDSKDSKATVGQNKSNKIKLDQIVKSLFTVSSKVLVNMMNSLFKENFDAEVTQVSFSKDELDIKFDNYDIIRGDLFIKLLTQEESQHYHIELQTKNDSTMILRMLEYGLTKAKELQKYEKQDVNATDNGKVIRLSVPKQLVIFIEENRSIEDELHMILEFPDGQIVNYTVPVIKYWTYRDKDILDNRMYPLLPLQIFKLRHKLERIKRRARDTREEQEKVIYDAKAIADIIGKEASSLFDAGEITGDDLHKILLANANIFEYLNDKYTQISELNKEVESNMKTLYDPAVAKRVTKEVTKEVTEKKAIKDAMKLLRLGVDEKIVSEGIELPLDKVLEIKQQIQRETVHA